MRSSFAFLAGVLTVAVLADIPADFDCGLRGLALEYGQHILGPVATASRTAALFDGLQLGSECGKTPPSPSGDPGLSANYDESAPSWYVAVDGSDSNPGTLEKPFATVMKAIDASRSTTSPRNVILRAGTHELSATIRLSTIDSGLTIAKYASDREAAVLSGSKSITPTWTPATAADLPHLGSAAGNVVKADVSGLGVFNEFYIEGRRGVRAKHPNGNPETTGLYAVNASATGWVDKAASWTARAEVDASRTVTKPIIPGLARYGNFSLGYDGTCDQFVPPASYWATAKPVAGGGSRYIVPNSLTWREGDLPDVDFTNPTDAVLHAYHSGHWGNWGFNVDAINTAKRTMSFSRGGFQEARGRTAGAQWYVENLKELLDSPGEWFLEKATSTLYLWPNSTTYETDSYAVPTLSTLVSIVGDEWKSKPVTGVTLDSVEFGYTLSTFMGAYEVPSAGDWSIPRMGAVEANGTEDVTIRNCVFNSLGGNGVYLRGYVNNTVIDSNEFVWLGASAVVAAGANNYETAEPWDHTAGEYPRFTAFTHNFVHEIGVYTKQSAGFFHAMSAFTTVSRNVIFNGPRSGVNFNDGFVGGNIVSENLMFALVRSTIDHGPFNSWSRQPYMWTSFETGKPTYDTLISHISTNFLLGSKSAQKTADHDDGSGFYHDSNNFCPYGSSKIKGWNVTTSNAVILFSTWSDVCVHQVVPIAPEAGLAYTNNTCVVQGSNIYALSGPCDSGNLMTSTNRFYTSGEVSVSCGKDKYATFTDWQKAGNDEGSTVTVGMPDTATMLQWGRDALGF